MQKRDGSNGTLPPSVLEQKYGWKNEPQRIRLMAERAWKDGAMETPEEQTAMKRTKKQKLPAGWSEERIRQLAEYYDNQTADEQAAEHEAALQAEGHTVMVVPTDLVPEILKLITKNCTFRDFLTVRRPDRAGG